MYYGSEFVINLSGNSYDRNYENTLVEEPLPIPSPYTRVLSYENGMLISGGFNFYFGAEYFLSRHFFVGAELNAALLLGYQLEEVTKRELYSPDSGNTPNLFATETERRKNGFRSSISNTTPVILRIGVRF